MNEGDPTDICPLNRDRIRSAFASRGLLNRQKWKSPRMTRNPERRRFGSLTRNPLTMTNAPSHGYNVTTLSVFSNRQCSSRIFDPDNLIFASDIILPTV